MDPILERYQALEDKIKEYNPALDAQRLFRAFTYADNAHAGQLRKDGSPYITHPLAVAEIVAELELDTDSIIAALLHDCIEDTGATHEEIAKLFGATVADLVEGVTKLTRVQYTSKEEEQMENLRKMLMAMAKDIRVILIKICDRLHNMRTMEYQSARKQKEKALETMEIYAPIAHRLACSASSGSWRTPPCNTWIPSATGRLPTSWPPAPPPMRSFWRASRSASRTGWTRRASAAPSTAG